MKSIILISIIAIMNLAAIDLNLLVAFEALMEERHVTRAAERIGLAQPSMSSALRRLRALFADELFLRAGAGMQPTEKALALAGPIGEALRQIRSALVPDQGFDPAIARRRITIAATDYGDLVVVPELTRLLRIEAPGIDLAVRPLTDATVALAKLERGELDALIGGHLPESPRCVRHRVFEERFVCVRDTARTNRSERLSLKDYATLPHALFSAAGGDSLPSVIDALLARHGLKRRVAVTLAHVVAVPFAVAGTDLIATMAERVARRFTHLADIAVVAPPIDIPAFAIDLIHPSRAARDPALRWFLDAVDRCAGRLRY
ncbi:MULTISPECIES: LysR family transcriptional regulator [Bradyrhizobium]|uniref:DNA-binding transcriptional LysR family regulator n=1 Tax=Bradyrhizobium elkanii TaxID=29448 RepID=A0A8I2BZ46_BRAEL|nr:MULTISPECIES: LysR family transcriptional regulator [Bradyrhizobium]MBP1292505.1 DNA-binding transcriptional LysR family regulator [Bradyrhizobium elkanii]MCP1926992.1 DNA-binding transcriptional LysR family regulator [Bradyrhizobium elkanii]MCS3475483.1 DNA-binding transcriptional LysR family regulator [Bradyrhizobium elkanii]MCS3582330.1 DNA-binding transcriptional LysR family regulator [Bradyrhizobium elkanii]MCS3715897.1 DNA-binding transcriptional LysR family regulator [Bradyrhizobium 